MANITNIEDIVKTWAWTMFLKTRSKEHNKLRLDDVQMEVNWSRVRFVSEKPDYSDGQMTDLPSAQVVFKSTFYNNTESEQEHSFQTERTTSCVSTVSMSKGFTKGFNLELTLGLPYDVAEITTGFGREVNMESGFEDSKEESLTWSVDSTVKVPPKHKTTAEMVVREKEFNATYKMTVKIRGIVVISITNLTNNNSFIQSVEVDFSELMKNQGKSGPEGFKVEDRTVIWTIAGDCKFRFGVEQQVKLKEEPLTDSTE